MRALILLFLSLPCYSQVVILPSVAYSKQLYYGLDLRYIEDVGIQQIHYGLKYANSGTDDFLSASISGYHGRALKWGFGSAITKYRENVSVSFNPLLSYNRKHLFMEAGSLIRVAYFGHDRNRWNHFLSLGYKW